MSVPFVPTQTLTLCSDQGLVDGGDSLQYAPPPLALATLALTDHLYSAIGGTTCAVKAGEYSSYYAPLYSSRRVRNVAALGCGVNDFVSLGQPTPATTYQKMLDWVVLAQATGYSVILYTVQSNINVDPFDPTWRPTLNALITGGAAGHGYTVVDWGANANLGCNGCGANATYFVDGVHFTDAGNVIAASLLKTALQGLGFQSI